MMTSVVRGDVVLVDYPYTDRTGSKVRPCIVVQNDTDNQRLDATIVVPQSHCAALAVRGNLLSLRAKDFQNLHTFLWRDHNTIRFCGDQHGAANSCRHRSTGCADFSSAFEKHKDAKLIRHGNLE